MQTLKGVRRRIKSISGTLKITGAMKLIAISKLREIHGRVHGIKLYCKALKELVLEVAAKSGEISHPAFVLRPRTQRIRVIVVASERGFCGTLNEQLADQVSHFLDMMRDRRVDTEIEFVGAHGCRYLARRGIRGRRLDVSTDDPLLDVKIDRLCRLFLEEYLSGKVDRVVIFYNEFLSTMSHRVALGMLLPIWVKDDLRPKISDTVDFLYEPEKVSILDKVMKETLRYSFSQCLMEGKASELATKMLAMDEAVRNSNEMLENLTHSYHRLRQARVTRGLLDIIGGAEALKAM